MTSGSKRLWQASPLTYGALILASLLSLFPFYFMFIVATRKLEVINAVPPPFTPGADFGENFGRVLDNEHAAFIYGLVNSVIVSCAVTISVVFFSALSGFAFAKLRFKGRNLLLLAIVGTMMVPTQLAIIPLYGMMQDWGWGATLQAVIVPFMVTAFGVFMMRQYASSAISDELIEAARVDGCSTFRIFWSVVAPALRPAAGVLGLLTFMDTWNSFLWPYAILDSDTPTVQVSLALLSSAYYTDYAQVFAATAVATVPLLLVFVVFGRQIIGGIMEGAVKA
ncbi:sugar ABC transporter permease [Catellatospora sp. TT07R-123]|uniref:carbohydrate ABC transporter permease n=1 Tax=Catellatospora sp. TT07R-123 TaxID=2733863 RepID=UPI001B2D6048|nr:carbohydrate ABC transporter permease [Catellatospora sp. TT07R-123]GHJ49539.1 sugar ABC transporter permease [Catellatospora sp. TT07R-123]